MISSELEAEIERLWRADGIHCAGTIARMVRVHRDVAVRVSTRAGLISVVVEKLEIPAPRASILDTYLPIIDEKLRKYPDIRASRIFFILKERGYRGVSQSHVRELVRKRRPVGEREAFLKLAMLPGEQAQVDWGHFGDAGEFAPGRKLFAFVMTLSYSRRIFLRFFLGMKMREFQQGFVEGFDFFGGVPRRVLIDNLKSGVTERVAHLVRFNDDFLTLAKHYAFEPVAANVRRGNEKGRVERSIRYIRDNFFEAREFTSISELNEQAAAWCLTLASERPWPQDRTKTVRQAYEWEIPKLMLLPATSFPCFERNLVKVSKQSLVWFDCNEYSVPPSIVGEQVEIIACEHQVRLLARGNLEPIAVHERCYGKGKFIEDAAHRAAILETKPGAKRHAGLSRLISLIPDAEVFVAALGERGENIGGAVSGLLSRIDTHGAPLVAQAVREVVASGSCTFKAVGFALRRLEHERKVILTEPALVSTRFGDIAVTPHDMRSYDDALGVKRDSQGN